MTAGDYIAFVVVFLNAVIFLYFIALNSSYLVLFTAAYFGARKYTAQKKSVDLYRVFRSPLTPSISVLIAAFNEEPVIVDSVRAALELQYPRFDVIVINDGSSDGTLERLRSEYGLVKLRNAIVETRVPSHEVLGLYVSSMHDNLLVVDKVNGGKADSLNAGINVSGNDIVCVVDADSLLEPDALLKIARPFIEDPGDTVAVGGVIRIANGCVIEGGRVRSVRLPRNYWANMQIVEYLRAFLGARLGWSALNALLIVSGAFGGFDRKTVIEIGGYRSDTVGEDMELVARMHRYLRSEGRPYAMKFIPDPVCWTQVPEGYRQLAHQRDRWQRGLIQTLAGNMEMLFNPRYGAVGMLAMPFFVMFEMVGPIVEIAGYILVVLALAIHRVSIQFLYLFLSVAILFGIIITLISIFLEGVAFGHFPRVRPLARLSVYAFAENIGYRQLNSWWRAKAYVTYFTRKRKWGEMERKSFDGESGG